MPDRSTPMMNDEQFEEYRRTAPEVMRLGNGTPWWTTVVAWLFIIVGLFVVLGWISHAACG